jgi:hypothetical protein
MVDHKNVGISVWTFVESVFAFPLPDFVVATICWPSSFENIIMP